MSEITFSDLGLGPKVEAAVEAAGYTIPTPIQQQAIPIALTGRDVLGIAQTGTGKTASFTLPMISRLERGRARARMPRSVILAPTRELAAQVAEAFEKYGVNHKLNVALLIGGVSFDEQNRKLDRGADVLIATPGRMLDHVQRGKLLLTGVEILVIDEADRMLDMGFIPDIERICKLLPTRRQTLFFSATMPPEIQRLVSQFLNDPERIEVAPPATTAKTITQTFHFCVDGEDWAKRELLRELIRGHEINNAIVFCNRKRDVAILYKSLTKHGFNAGALHGDMDQTSRMQTLAAFRAGDISILAASDVAARGLDIPDVSHVFNFDVPLAADDYVHRIGRTGRAGRSGCAATLVGLEDLSRISDIEKITGEAPAWEGEEPTDEDFADAKSRKRGRSGRRRGSGSASTGGANDQPRDRQSQARSGGRSSARGRSRSRRGSQTSDAIEVTSNDAIDAHNASTSAGVDDHVQQPSADQQNAVKTAAAPTQEAGPAPRRQRANRSGAGSGRNREQQETAAAVTPMSTAKRPDTNTTQKRAKMTDEERAELSFGGNVPAFLQRPVRRTPKARENAE